MNLILADTDIKVDLAAIIIALAPSILIVVTYFFSKNQKQQLHDINSNKLDEIAKAVTSQDKEV